MKPQYLIHGLPQEWDDVGRVFTALGENHRQRILLAFEPGERLSIREIAAHLSLSRTAVVYHLKTLHEAGLLHCEKSGRESLYRLEPARVQWALDALQVYLNALRGEP